jgi:HK97 family phage prohead protease
MSERPPIEIRTATAMEVRYPERQIDLVAVPYDEMTEVLYRGRPIRESVTRGAFEGIQMRSHSFKVNRAHDGERPVGWVTKFRPRDERGLVAEIDVIPNVRDGDEALELAAAGLLGASIGFAVLNEDWSVDRKERRVTKAWLDHIALTGTPAYQGAQVLAVRATDGPASPAARVPTPNLDLVRLWQMQDRYSRAQP